MKLFQLIWSRESCNPNEAIEPGSSRCEEDRLNDDGCSENINQQSDIPSDTPYLTRGKKRRTGVKDDLKSAVLTFNKLMENDPTRDILKQIQEENEVSRKT